MRPGITLPTFLGIGVPRAGTTWLHTLLSSHPQAYLPTRRKEVRFFDRHFGEGLEWYGEFFGPPEALEGCRAIGEISPQYLYGAECPDRIAEVLPGAKLVVMLRHPVDRAYSQFGFVVQRRNYRGSFEEFLRTRPRALEMGFYSAPLKHYLRVFDRSQILALVFETAVGTGGTAREDLAGFLGLPVDGFATEVEAVNASTVPRFGSLSNLAVSTGRRLRRRHLETLVDLGGRLGIRRVLTSGTRVPRLDPALRQELSERYLEEFDALEDLLDLDLSTWRDRSSVRGTS
jgi:sulfotransferase family protein